MYKDDALRWGPSSKVLKIEPWRSEKGVCQKYIHIQMISTPFAACHDLLGLGG
jgi:hypothetical protein